MRIMIIDDSTTMRLIMSRALKELGHEIVQAGNGKEGLAAAQTAEPLSAIFVDWNMPEMNGYDFVLAARLDARLKTVPILLVTTENEAANVQKALDAGANGFIRKPFTKDILQQKIAELGVA